METNVEPLTNKVKLPPNTMDFGNPEITKMMNFEDSMEFMQGTLDYFNRKDIEYCVYDSETTSFDHWKGKIIMYSFAHDKYDAGVSIPLSINNRVDHDPLPYDVPIVSFDITEKEKYKIIELAKEIFHTIPMVGHNLKFDTKFLVSEDMGQAAKMKIHMDTYIQAVQVYGQLRGWRNDLKTLCRKLCGAPNWDFNIDDYIGRYRLIKQRNYGNIPTGMLGEYAALDAYWNKKLFHYLNKEMDNRGYGRLMANRISYATKPFTEIETHGIFIYNQMLDFLGDNYKKANRDINEHIKQLPVVNKYINNKVEEAIPINNKKRKPLPEQELFDTAFNINSHSQLREMVYENYTMKSNKRHNTGSGLPSTSKEALNYMLDKYLREDALYQLKENVTKQIKDTPDPVIRRELKSQMPKIDKLIEAKDFLTNVLTYKRFSKLISTYINPVPLTLVDGCYMPKYSLTGTVTGRLSSSFHTLPKKSDIKRMYGSRWLNSGGLFFASDYSQIEVRIAATLSGETKLIEAYKAGIDVHKKGASEAYGIPIDQVTDDQRSDAKAVVFGLLFGKTADSLAQDLGKSVAATQKVIDGIFGGYDKLAGWMESQEKFVKKHGYIETPWDRRIFIDNAFSTKFMHQLEAARCSRNYPIQATASDIVLNSIINIWDRTKEENLRSLLIGTVHDSIEYDVYPGELFKMANMFQEECVDKMSASLPWLTCPLAISFELGTSWGSALECKVKERSDKHLVLKAEGLRKDFRALKVAASKAYNFELDVHEVKKMDESKFGKDTFVRDLEWWEGTIRISQK